MRVSLLPRLHHRMMLLPVMAIIISACAVTAQAQMGGIDTDPGDPGTGGRNTIQGSIFLPGGRRLDRRVKVKLRGIATSEQFQMSDDNGAFSFRRLHGGKYTVIVDAGPQFEVLSEAVDVIEPPRRRGDPGIVIPIYLTLQPKRPDPSTVVGTVAAPTTTVPEAARDLYTQALESSKAGDRKKAIAQLNQAIAICPEFMLALNELGAQYLNLKQYDKATEAFRAALKVAPEAFYPRLNLGIVLFQQKDYQGAAVELERAVNRDSTSAAAYFHLGRAQVNLGNYAAAEKSLRSCVSIGGDVSTEAHRYLAAAYIETKQGSRAADELDTYLKLAPHVKDADQIRRIIQDLRAQAKAR